MADDNMGSTKEKILFETNELVISLNTQVAVLTNSNNELKRAVETYTERMDKKIDKMDERDATLDQRITILRNDLTKEQGRIDNLQESVKELKGKSNLFDFINFVVTAIVGALAYFFGPR
jgi:predicted RNase H-like nuclease (RuvC/YqgF family)